MKSTIRLFKAVPITEQGKKDLNIDLLKKIIPHGFLFAPEVVYNYPNTELDDLISTIIKEFGLTGNQMNSSFHKSWEKVAKADILQLVTEQLLHYFTTYGFKDLGIYSEESVYIPREKLDIPEIDVKGFHFVIIKGYTKEELKKKLLDLLEVGIALGEETITDVSDLTTYLEFTETDLGMIKNKEVKIALYEYLGLFPENPIEFLRYCVYRSTGHTLLIKNKETIEKIKENNNLAIVSLFSKYKRDYGFEKLAQIFLRFKPLFLAFRTNAQMRKFTNKIRKLAKIHHKPMKKDYLNQVTALIKNDMIDKSELQHKLSKVNIFRKIRLAYALKYRTTNAESILYRIRNGKGFATEFVFDRKEAAEDVLSVVLDSIVDNIRENINGKKIYIPDFVNYTMPATEKQFTGNFPSGTFISIPRDMVIGIHWENVKDNQIDLDLSVISPLTGKIGWDSKYRTEGGGILFSGDLTDAPKPNGASELFYLQKHDQIDYICFVNFYNYSSDIVVPFNILVAKEQVKVADNPNFMVNPDNIVIIVKTKINQYQKILGLLVTLPDECRFYFAETNIGRSITAYASAFSKHSQRYLTDFYKNTISLKNILRKAGAIFTNDQNECDINLSPESIEKDTIIKIFQTP